jgi:hypothetical protein
LCVFTCGLFSGGRHGHYLVASLLNFLALVFAVDLGSTQDPKVFYANVGMNWDNKVNTQLPLA